MTKEMVTNKLQEQIKYQEKIIKNNKKHQQTVSDKKKRKKYLLQVVL